MPNLLKPEGADGRQGEPVEFVESGLIVHGGIPLAEVNEWIEDGLRVVSAKDFDLTAVGATEQEAIDNFAGEVISLLEALEGTLERGEATQQEQELYLRIARPIVTALQEILERERRRRGSNRENSKELLTV